MGCGAVDLTTGGMNSSSCIVALRRLRHHNAANSAASSPAAPAIHGQIDAPEVVSAADPAVSMVGPGPGTALLLGSGNGVIAGALVLGDGAALAACAAPEVMRGAGAALRGAALVRGVGTGLTAALGAVVGLATGTGDGVGLGRGAGARMIGASASTGPCARGLLVGRPVGIEKSGTPCVCAAKAAGTSNSASAAAPVTVFALPPEFTIELSISVLARALAPHALNRK